MTLDIIDKQFDFTEYFSGSNIKNNRFKWNRKITEESKIVCFTEKTSHIAYKYKSKDKTLILIILEPNQIKKWFNINNLCFDEFDYVFTFDKKLLELNKDKEYNKFIYYPYISTWIKREDFFIYDKRRLCSCIMSNLNITTGHKLRHEVKNRYKNIDYYGKGAGKHIEYKLTGLKDYMYSIVIENEILDDYFTEKIIDCFMTGTVPIYYGTKNIGKYFDTNGIIQFTKAEELDVILNKIGLNDYNSRKTAIVNNFNNELLKKYDYLADNYIYEKIKELCNYQF